MFVLLLFGSFWFGRKEPQERWILAAVLAALATVTRAVGIFALVALGLNLLLRKEYRKLTVCIALAALIGFLYLLPFWIAFHDPLYQFHRRVSRGLGLRPSVDLALSRHCGELSVLHGPMDKRRPHRCMDQSGNCWTFTDGMEALA